VRSLEYIFSIVCLLVALTAQSSESLAQQPAPTDGTTCFCLQHDDGLKQVIRNCRGFRPPKASEVTASCRGDDPATDPTKITVAPPWTVILEDQQGCKPCQGSRATIKVPRNESEDK
jgi:hypothetical protein